MKLPTQDAPASIDGGCNVLYIYKTKHERLLKILSFLLPSDSDTDCPVIVADEGMVSLVDSVLHYSSGRQSRTQLYPVVVEELAIPGEILRAEPFIKAVERELDSAQQRCGVPPARLVLDMQFIAAQIGSAADLTQVARQLRRVSASRTVSILTLFFAETLPKYGLQPFLDQFDRVALCDTLQRFVCRHDSDSFSAYHGALLQLALGHESVVQQVLTIDAAEPRGSTFVPETAVRGLPQLSDIIDDALLLIDPKLQIVFCSRVAAGLLGGRRSALLGTALDRHLRTADVESVRRRIRGRAGSADSIASALRVTLLSGQMFDVELHAIELADISIAHVLQLRPPAGPAAEHSGGRNETRPA